MPVDTSTVNSQTICHMNLHGISLFVVSIYAPKRRILKTNTYPICFDSGSGNGAVDGKDDTLKSVRSKGNVGDFKPVLH